VPGRAPAATFHWWYLLAIPLALAIAFVSGYSGYATFNKAVVKSNHPASPGDPPPLSTPRRVLSAPTTLLVLGSDQRATTGPLRQHPAHAVRPRRTP